MADEIEIRTITEGEVADFRRAVELGFGLDQPSSELTDEGEADERFRRIFPLETSLAAFDQGQMVATFGSFDMQLTVPGGLSHQFTPSQVPMAGTTIVTVDNTYRRRGLLTRMMWKHFEIAAELGQSVAGLWASDERIYRRFGYGIAALSNRLTVNTDLVPFMEIPDGLTLRRLHGDQHRDVLPKVYEQARRSRPGTFARNADWWDVRHFHDPPDSRGGATSLRRVAIERDGQPVGYVSYRQQSPWDTSIEIGTVTVQELIAVDDDARRGLWAHLWTIDLYPEVSWWNAPVDEPLPLEVGRYRSMKSVHGDTLWLRILDVEAALSARRYETDGAITLALDDPFCNRTHHVELSVFEGTGQCRTLTVAEVTPDVRLDIADLGSLYLGGGSAHQMAAAGRIQGSGEAIARLGRIFATQQAPWCPEVF